MLPSRQGGGEKAVKGVSAYLERRSRKLRKMHRLMEEETYGGGGGKKNKTGCPRTNINEKKGKDQRCTRGGRGGGPVKGER